MNRMGDGTGKSGELPVAQEASSAKARRDARRRRAHLKSKREDDAKHRTAPVCPTMPRARGDIGLGAAPTLFAYAAATLLLPPGSVSAVSVSLPPVLSRVRIEAEESTSAASPAAVPSTPASFPRPLSHTTMDKSSEADTKAASAAEKNDKARTGAVWPLKDKRQAEVSASRQPAAASSRHILMRPSALPGYIPFG